MMAKFIECYGNIINIEELECVCKFKASCTLRFSFVAVGSDPLDIDFETDEELDICYEYLKGVLCVYTR